MAAPEGTPPLDYQLEIAQKKFLYLSTDIPELDKSALEAEIVELVKQHDAVPLYESLAKELGWSVDPAIVSPLKEAIERRENELKTSLEDAEANAGEVEVRDALAKWAEYLEGVGAHDRAKDMRAEALKKTAGTGPKLDLAYGAIRADIAAGDWAAVGRGLDEAHELAADGGDWERRNRLKVYEALYAIAARRSQKAAELLLDAVATFTATELLTYDRLAFYAVLFAIIALDRPSLKQRVLDAPEILAVIDEQPHLRSLLNSLYACDYSAYIRALAEVGDQARRDRYLRPHLRHLLLELRVVVYSQYLESYRSVTLKAAAETFGLSQEFLEQELFDLIVRSRISAKLDAVQGAVLTTRPDLKNARYQQTIKTGDALLNRIQILSKVIDIE